MDPRRAESFSDAIFAVAITVLVFNLLPIADATRRDLTPGTLGHYWPAYLAYAVSFLTIGIMWLNHHTILAQVTRVNRALLVVNLLLLMGIVAIPFPTALVADHLTGPQAGHGQATVAAVTYGLVMIAISICYAALWLYLAVHQQTLGAGSALRVRAPSTIWFTAGNAGYVAATLIALVSPISSLVIYGLLAVYYMFEHLPAPAARAGSEGEGGG